ncbi:MAG: molybdopterin molybdotransferase MoeA [Beijerinckiaceae bacterium]
MAQLTDDCFAVGGPMLTIEQAVALMQTRITPVTPVLSLPLGEADGHVLAEPVVARLNVPPFDNSAVDGFAVSQAELNQTGETTLPVAGRIIAGAASMPQHQPQTAARIFTGARMPAGADTVFMQEDVRESDGHVSLPAGLKRGANARACGEDVQKNTVVLAAGHRMRPQDLALAAAVGVHHVTVRQPLRVAIFSTGNELSDHNAPLDDTAIYDANRPMLIALLRRMGASVSDLGIVRDAREIMTEALQQAARDHDLVLTTGGVSTGDEDHVKAAVEAIGSLVFWRIGIKPGRPVALGILRGGGNDAVFCGLPGNPVAAFVTFTFVVRPLIARLMGADPAPVFPVSVRAGFSYKKKKDRREFVRVSLIRQGADWIAKKHPQDGAGVITSMTATDGLIALPEDVTQIAEGEALAFYPYAVLMG